MLWRKEEHLPHCATSWETDFLLSLCPVSVQDRTWSVETLLRDWALRKMLFTSISSSFHHSPIYTVWTQITWCLTESTFVAFRHMVWSYIFKAVMRKAFKCGFYIMLFNFWQFSCLTLKWACAVRFSKNAYFVYKLYRRKHLWLIDLWHIAHINHYQCW